MFAEATGDHQWIHVDAALAPRPGRSAARSRTGILTLSLMIPLFGELLEVTGISMGINYGLNKVRFPTPVPVGSKIRLAGQVAAVDAGRGRRGAAHRATSPSSWTARHKPACVAQAIYRYYA